MLDGNYILVNVLFTNLNISYELKIIVYYYYISVDVLNYMSTHNVYITLNTYASGLSV